MMEYVKIKKHQKGRHTNVSTNPRRFTGSICNSNHRHTVFSHGTMTEITEASAIVYALSSVQMKIEYIWRSVKLRQKGF